MGVRSKDVRQTIAEKTLTPIFRSRTEQSSEGPGGHLHPCALARQVDKYLEVIFDPSEAFGMSDDRNVAGADKLKNRFGKPGRGYVVRRLK